MDTFEHHQAKKAAISYQLTCDVNYLATWEVGMFVAYSVNCGSLSPLKRRTALFIYRNRVGGPRHPYNYSYR